MAVINPLEKIPGKLHLCALCCLALETENLFSLDFLRILIFPSLTLGLMLYFWLVVRSAYMYIRETPVLPIYVDDDTKIEKAGGKYIRM